MNNRGYGYAAGRMSPTVYGKALAFGATAGLRTAAPAVALQRRVRAGSVLLVAAALGELIGDKLPQMPSRLAWGPLTGRAASGFYAGVEVARRTQSSRIAAGMLGSLGAVCAAYGFYRVRKLLASKVKLPDMAIAIAEDAIGYIAAFAIARTMSDKGNR